jgi:hypothetical protein
MIDVKGTVDEIVKRTGITDPKSIELITRITVRGTELSARALAGEDVEKEQFHLRAQASNLGEVARRQAGAVITERIAASLSAVLTKALIG